MAPPAQAQRVPLDVDPLQLDLDGDGQAETFSMIEITPAIMSLVIKRPGKPDVIARDFAWNTDPVAALSRAPNGSLRAHTAHTGIGRRAHEQTLTIAFRNGAYQVVGLTRVNWDRIEPHTNTTCDMNLITGRGTVNDRSVRVRARAKVLTSWAWDGPLPAGCFIP
jgi:hypothetical protein